jgi:hypothetical protein
MNDPYAELFGLLQVGERKEPLTPERRAKEFLLELQRIKNGDEVLITGFIILRMPPNAPRDAVYYIVSALPPGELGRLSKSSPRPYAIIRIDEETRIEGRLRSGSYVEIRGLADTYPWGSLRLIRALSIKPLSYSDYWKSYREYALTPLEVEELLSTTVYISESFREGLLYSLYGGTPLLESPREWGEGSEFSVFGHRGREAELITLWRILRVIHSSFPWELQFRKERRMGYSDPFLDIDFTIFNPNDTQFRYYTPGSPTKVSRFARKAIEAKRAVGLLPIPKRANPLDRLVSVAEVPLVFIPREDERPYLQDTRELSKLMPNLIATIFLERAKYGSVSIREKPVGKLREKFEEWLIEKRSEYGWKFDALTIPGAVFDVRSRYELTVRLFGSIGRFRGRLGKGEIRRAMEINEEALNDWMVVMDSLPQTELQKLLNLKEYRSYMPADRGVAKALEVFRDIEATTLREDVSRKEFIRALIKVGFSEGWAEETLERLIREGYLYEPARGKLRLVK